MIREAEEGDIPEIIRMGRLFFDANAWPGGMEFNEKSVVETVRNLIEDKNSVIFISNGGMAAGLVFPLYFTGDLAGQELFWWVDPEKRGGLGIRLIAALENWARDSGARHFSMISLDALSPERVGKIYEQRGYRAMEHHYMRIL